MKKLSFALLLMLLLGTACNTAAPAATDNYPATLVAMEVQLKLMEEAMQATSQAYQSTLLMPTATPPTPPPCPTCAPATLVVTATPSADATSTPRPSPTEGENGSISGALNYTTADVPAQRVIAYNIDTGYYYWQNTNAGTTGYSFSKLPAGRYNVLSYLISDPKNVYAGYSQAVVCGLTADCTDHSLVTVEVKGGENTPNINVFDWYPNPGSLGWRADPTQKQD